MSGDGCPPSEEAQLRVQLEQARADNERYKKALAFYYDTDANRAQSGFYVRENEQGKLVYDDGYTAYAALYPEKCTPEYQEQLENEIWGKPHE